MLHCAFWKSGSHKGAIGKECFSADRELREKPWQRARRSGPCVLEWEGLKAGQS